MRFLYLILSVFIFSGCAVLHHVQVGDIDNRRSTKSKRGKRINLMVSETGVNLQEAADIAKSLTRSKAAQGDIEQFQEYLRYFQYGPKTGNPVYVEDYARKIFEGLYAECPSGKLTNLMMIRESNKYPVISGEIVRIIGDCYF